MPPLPVAFDVSPSVVVTRDLPKWGSVALQPAGCDATGAGAGARRCTGYVQSAGEAGGAGASAAEERANEMRALPVARAAFASVGSAKDGAGSPAPIARLKLRNNGAMMPQDVGAPILTVRLSLAPVSPRGGGDAPPGTDASVDLSFGVMWSPGGGAPPNNAGLFSLVHPLPSRAFVAYGVRHRVTVTGLRAAAAGPGGAAAAGPGPEGRPVWWKKDGGASAAEEGFGAMVVPMDGRTYDVEVLADVAVVE